MPGTTGGQRTLGGLPSGDAGARARCAGGRVAGLVTLCPPAVRGRAFVGACAGAASGGYFGAFVLVAVWGVPWLLRAGRMLCGKVSNNAYSQDSQEFGAPAGAYWPGSLACAQGPAVACPPRTPLCASAGCMRCIAQNMHL